MIEGLLTERTSPIFIHSLKNMPYQQLIVYPKDSPGRIGKGFWHVLRYLYRFWISSMSFLLYNMYRMWQNIVNMRAICLYKANKMH